MKLLVCSMTCNHLYDMNNRSTGSEPCSNSHDGNEHEGIFKPQEPGHTTVSKAEEEQSQDEPMVGLGPSSTPLSNGDSNKKEKESPSLDPVVQKILRIRGLNNLDDMGTCVKDEV
jgi:hypothetical protein